MRTSICRVIVLGDLQMNAVGSVLSSVLLSAVVLGLVYAAFPFVRAPKRKRAPDAFRLEVKLNAEICDPLRQRQLTECAILFAFSGIVANLALAIVAAYPFANSLVSYFSAAELHRLLVAPIVKDDSSLGGMGWVSRMFLASLICAGLLVINSRSLARARARDLKDYLTKDRITPSVSALFASWLAPKKDFLLEPRYGDLAVQKTIAAIWRDDLAEREIDLKMYLAREDFSSAIEAAWGRFVGPQLFSRRAAVALTVVGVFMVVFAITRVLPL